MKDTQYILNVNQSPRTINYFNEECDGKAGAQYIFKFDNGYGASVVKHDFSYGHESGLWELAVIKFLPDSPLTFRSEDWNIEYDTPITDDVLGHLSNEGVQDALDEVERLVGEY